MMCIESHLITSRGRLEHAVHIVSRRSTSHTQHLPVLNVQSCTLPLLFHTLLWPEIHTHPLSSVRPSHILSTLSLSLTNTICIITIIFLLLFLYDCSLWSSGANSWRKKQRHFVCNWKKTSEPQIKMIKWFYYDYKRAIQIFRFNGQNHWKCNGSS